MSGAPGASGVTIGRTLSHYRIAALLGEGGMGVVYRARDERLKRDVALKVLTAERLGDEAARRRFRNEALALSRLNHPNIQAVYDFDTDGGIDFLVTEYVPGLTLRDRVASGAIPINEALALGGQLADGLAEAHARGIVHRDLKPENIKITAEGRLKILDFGIAQSNAALTETFATTEVAESPAIMGTLPYMAPEQLRGEPTDARTDLFAIGCVLYEVCTGKRAFSEKVTPRLIESILLDAPIPPRQIEGQIPGALERIILRCLQKQPRDRYQSAAELATDLKRLESGRITLPAWSLSRRQWLVAAAVTAALIAGAWIARRFWPASPRIRSIAVLPMQNLSGDPAQEYFADGMTDALITDLGRLGGLQRVIARGSMMRYKKTTKTLPEIARELNVDALVSGAVVRDGNRVRVTAELIDPKTQAQLWSDAYERDLRNVLALQSDLATTIAGRIKGKLTRDESRRLSGRREPNREAFDAYLKGQSYAYKATAKDLALRMQFLQLAVQKDPEFAGAHAKIAAAWTARVVYGFSPPREALPQARAAALRALQLDPDSAEAHLALAVVKHYLEWDWSGAEREYQRAIELDPSSPDVRFQYATLLGPTLQRPEDWKAQMDRCLELDPLSQHYRYFRGRHLMTLRKPQESLAALNQVLKEAPDFALIHDGLWYAYESTHQYDRALIEAQKSYEVKADTESLKALQEGGGNYQLAMRRGAEVLERRSAQKYVPAAQIARLYTYAGDREKALMWLQRAYDTHDQGMTTLNTAPIWDSLRDDPRFQDILRRMNFPSIKVI